MCGVNLMCGVVYAHTCVCAVCEYVCGLCGVFGVCICERENVVCLSVWCVSVCVM